VARPQPGLVSIAGGKLTTYRVMAADAVDAAADDLAWLAGRGAPAPSVTQQVPLIGADGYAAMRNLVPELSRQTGLAPWRVEHLLGRYGSLLTEVLALADDDRSLLEPVPTAQEYLTVELRYGATHEAALHLEDLLARRTRMSIETRDRGVASAPLAAQLVAHVLGWDESTVTAEVDAYAARVDAERQSQLLADDAASDAARRRAPDVRPGLRSVTATR
jgi:glycerol-3-phosphate dehydrogenase